MKKKIRDLMNKFRSTTKTMTLSSLSLLRKISGQAAPPLHIQLRSETKNAIHVKMCLSATQGKTETLSKPQRCL